MRGTIIPQKVLFSYVNLEERIPANHPLRKIKQTVDECLKTRSGVLDRLYAKAGRPSLLPEMRIKAILHQVFYVIRTGADTVTRLRPQTCGF